jgi:hypothetical protein
VKKMLGIFLERSTKALRVNDKKYVYYRKTLHHVFSVDHSCHLCCWLDWYCTKTQVVFEAGMVGIFYNLVLT